MTTVLRRVRSLGLRDWILLTQAGVVVVVSRVALWTGGLRVARRLVALAAAVVGRCDEERASWAVAAVGRRVPGASCLTQALALQAMFERAGVASRVEIGVANAGRFEAHAWVVCRDRVVLGGPGHDRFQTVVTLD